MLPNRKSSPAPRADGIVAEVRVPERGTSFVAIVSSLRDDGVLLWTSHELEPGTDVLVELDVPGGRLHVDGTVGESHVKNGLAIAFADLDDDARGRIESIAPGALRVA